MESCNRIVSVTDNHYYMRMNNVLTRMKKTDLKRSNEQKTVNDPANA